MARIAGLGVPYRVLNREDLAAVRGLYPDIRVTRTGNQALIPEALYNSPELIPGGLAKISPSNQWYGKWNPDVDGYYTNERSQLAYEAANSHLFDTDSEYILRQRGLY